MEQNKKKICWIRVLKNVSYVLAPVLIAMLVLSISCVFFTDNMGIEKEEEYIETSKFAEEYLSFIRTTINRINSKEKSYKREVNENITESLEYIGNFVYLVIDNKTGVGYVNGNHDFSYITVNKWKEEILSNKLYWCYENGKINTSIDKISEQQMVDTSFYENSLKDCNLTIYTAL